MLVVDDGCISIPKNTVRERGELYTSENQISQKPNRAVSYGVV